jgi:uncharacterized membrane protein (DUF4010 family)
MRGLCAPRFRRQKLVAHHPTFLLAVALAVGFLIGVERGWEKRESAEGSRVSGVRTYGLLGLLGGVVGLLSQQLGGALLGFAFLGIAVTLTAAYVVSVQRSPDVSLTSVVAGVLTFTLGAMVGLGYVMEASAAAVVTTLLLGFKPVLHGWLRALHSEELRAGIELLLISVVLLPILPNQGYGPWQALNPYQVWWMVVLIASISFCGYFAMRLAGPGTGAVLTGLFAGLASSTALTLHFSRLTRHQPELANVLAPGILIACGTMYPRIVLVSLVVNPGLLQSILIPAVVMTSIVYAAAFWQLWRRGNPALQETAPVQNPLELAAAIRFGLLLVAILLLSEALKRHAGEAGLYLLAAISGIADVDAITLSLGRMSALDLSLDTAVMGIVLASAVNSLVKAGLSVGVGTRALGARVAVPLLLSAATGLLVTWWWLRL